MDGHIKVNTEALQSQADTVSGLINNVSSLFSEMKGLVGRSTSYWVGEAGNSFRDKYSSQESKFEEAIRRLNENVTDLRTMAGVYSTAENQALNEASQLISEVIV